MKTDSQPREINRTKLSVAARHELVMEAGYKCGNPTCRNIITLEIHQKSKGKVKRGHCTLVDTLNVPLFDLIFTHFVNRVCKYNAEGHNIHHCNHHLPYCFADMNDPCSFSNPIELQNVNLANGDVIQYPKLTDLVDAVLTAYAQVERLLMSDETALRELCKEFDDPNFNVE